MLIIMSWGKIINKMTRREPDKMRTKKILFMGVVAFFVGNAYVCAASTCAELKRLIDELNSLDGPPNGLSQESFFSRARAQEQYKMQKCTE